MRIRIGYDISFDVAATTPMILMLFVHPDRAQDLEAPETILLDPVLPSSEFVDVYGNRCERIVAPPGVLRIRSESIIRDTGEPEWIDTTAIQHPVESLPFDVMPFLLASRYCEVDRLTADAWRMFGNTPLGWPRVKAVLDWVHEHVVFGYQFADSTKTAWQVMQDRCGVCRDFMHLAVTFLRCLNIPARYATGYLGDIGVPADPAPMDFSAYLEVYLGGKWWALDARHNKARIGRVCMGRGRDAVDVALTTAFGATTLKRFTVISDELK